MRALYTPKGIQTSVDRRIADVAERQHGVITRAQAVECGATADMIKWRLRRRWDLLHPRTYRLAGSAPTWHQRAIAACLYLGPHAVLSHHAAVSLHNGNFKRAAAAVEVTMPRNRNRPGAVIAEFTVHQVTQLILDQDITTIDGIPVTRPARTLLDLASVEREHIVEQHLDDALRRHLVSVPFLQRWLRDPRRRRHRGAARLNKLIDDRATGGVTDSHLETQVLRALKDAGLPIPILQYVVRDGNRFVARVDFAYPNERVAIEADSFRYHDRRDQFDDERARGNVLESLGWHVLRVTSRHVEEHPEDVADWVRRALNRQV